MTLEQAITLFPDCEEFERLRANAPGQGGVNVVVREVYLTLARAYMQDRAAAKKGTPRQQVKIRREPKIRQLPDAVGVPPGAQKGKIVLPAGMSGDQAEAAGRAEYQRVTEESA